jgi:hypothetical protein
MFVLNYATRGGAVYCSDDFHAWFTACSICTNDATEYGGGVYTDLNDSLSPFFFHCWFNLDTADRGGAMYLEDCLTNVCTSRFTKNSSEEAGGAIYANSSNNVMCHSTFTGNKAGNNTGHVSHEVYSARVLFYESTVAGNGSGGKRGGDPGDAAISVGDQCQLFADRTIVAYTTGGQAVSCEGSGTATLECCDLYDNDGGNWEGCIANQNGIRGNFSGDPLFCDPDNGDYHLLSNSPCAPQQQPTCGLIGALDVGCNQAAPGSMPISEAGTDIVFTSGSDTLAILNFAFEELDSVTIGAYRGMPPPNIPEGSEWVHRYYSITPIPEHGSFEATMTLFYSQSEFDASGLSDELELGLCRYRDSWSAWVFHGGIVDPERNSITLSGVTEFSFWGMTDSTNTPPMIRADVIIPNTDCVNPGDHVCIPILLENHVTPFGGFELEVEFDYTSMTFVGAEPGELIEGFEKFTYRLLPCPSCGCCKYKILLYGQYDMPNGVENIGDPIPLTQPGGYQVLVELCFVVNNDENLRGLKIPVCWEWEGTVVNDTLVEDWECGENTFSSWSGDTLFASHLLCQFNPDLCDDPSDRVQPIVIFQLGICGQNCGGVDVCPAGPGECKRGDVNMNTLTYEVADAVLFASYFVEGTSVFRYDVAYQICATDVNADGRTLTLSDLVYLIRVILHDAVEIPKLTPSSEVANVIVSGGTITTECAASIGAILFEFDADVVPTLLADMEMLHSDNKVLVWSSKGKSFSTAEVLSFEGKTELVTATAVDRDSRELTTSITGKVAPLTFALHPAYPNPFNPFTNLSFTLPEVMEYTLRIYNVAGQLVRSYEDVGSAGLNMIKWDSKDNVGVEVASGVYFYKLTAGGFSSTEKMVILK